MLCQLRGPGSNNTPVAMSTAKYPQHGTWFLIPFFNKRNKSPLEKYLVQRLGQAINMMSLEHLIVPESKEVIHAHTHKISVPKKHRNILRELLMAKAGTT